MTGKEIKRKTNLDEEIGRCESRGTIYLCTYIYLPVIYTSFDTWWILMHSHRILRCSIVSLTNRELRRLKATSFFFFNINIEWRIGVRGWKDGPNYDIHPPSCRLASSVSYVRREWWEFVCLFVDVIRSISIVRSGGARFISRLLGRLGPRPGLGFWLGARARPVMAK